MHDFSGFSFCLTSWLFGMIEIDILSVLLEVLPVVLEMKKETLYYMSGPLDTLIDDFISLIS